MGAERVNFSFFEGAAVGKQVAVLGRFTDGNKLTTTDGGVLSVVCDQTLEVGALKGFAEVIGAKEEGSVLRANAVLHMGEQVDVELWDEAVKMAHQPQLSSLFTPA